MYRLVGISQSPPPLSHLRPRYFLHSFLCKNYVKKTQLTDLSSRAIHLQFMRLLLSCFSILLAFPAFRRQANSLALSKPMSGCLSTPALHPFLCPASSTPALRNHWQFPNQALWLLPSGILKETSFLSIFHLSNPFFFSGLSSVWKGGMEGFAISGRCSSSPSPPRSLSGAQLNCDFRGTAL